MSAPEPVAAFDAIYRSEHPRLLRKLRRSVGPDEAPDLVQEVFTRMFNSGALKRMDNPAAYLNRIARNLLIDRARQKKRSGAVIFPIDENRDAVSRPEQSWQIEALDLLRVYRQAVRAMPPKTRRVFLMHRHHRMTYKQIAERIGIRIATVDYHMMRATVLYRAAIADNY